MKKATFLAEVNKWGNGNAIRVPSHICKSMNLFKGSPVEITIKPMKNMVKLDGLSSDIADHLISKGCTEREITDFFTYLLVWSVHKDNTNKIFEKKEPKDHLRIIKNHKKCDKLLDGMMDNRTLTLKVIRQKDSQK